MVLGLRHAPPRPRNRPFARYSSTLPAVPSKPPPPTHAVISTFDLFSIGVGPSSSHTVGPMRAAKIFTHSLPPSLIPHIAGLKISLHGSLAATGLGHMTPHAILLGLMGEDPESVEVGRLGRVMDEVREVGEVGLGLRGGVARVKFDLERDLVRYSMRLGLIFFQALKQGPEHSRSSS